MRIPCLLGEADRPIESDDEGSLDGAFLGVLVLVFI